MSEDLTGRWPWETGEMDVCAQPQTHSAQAGDAMLYTLPRVKDRRAENGTRSASVKDLVRMKRAREGGTDRYFRW